MCVVLLSSSERQSETRDMMETTTTATTTGREAEEGTSSRETLENHPGNAGSRATEDLQEGQQLQEGKGDEAFGRGSALGGPDGIVVDASNPVVAHTPAARSLGLGKDPVSKVLGGGVAKALKPTSTAAARSEKKRRNEIRRRWARATDAKSTSLSSSSTLTCRLPFFLCFFLSSGRWTKNRIDVLRTMLPDTVRNKNVIEVLDDTILLINNLRDMVSQANSQLAATR